jgi:hypothetical protein
VQASARCLPCAQRSAAVRRQLLRDFLAMRTLHRQRILQAGPLPPHGAVVRSRWYEQIPHESRRILQAFDFLEETNDKFMTGPPCARPLSVRTCTHLTRRLFGAATLAQAR